MELQRSIRCASSIDALLSLHASQPSTYTLSELTLTLNRMRKVMKHAIEQKEGLIGATAEPFLSDVRFNDFIDHLRLALSRSTSQPAHPTQPPHLVLRDVSFLFQAIVPPGGHATSPITTRREVGGTAVQRSEEWPPSTSLLLNQLLPAVRHAQKRQQDNPKAAMLLLRSVGLLVSAGCFHPLYPSLLSPALHTLLQPSSEVWWIECTLKQLSILALNLSIVVDVAESAAAAVTSVAERIVRSVQRRPLLDPVSDGLTSAPVHQLEWLCLLPYRCKAEAYPLYWERLCSALLSVMSGSSFRCLTSVISSLSIASYYHEPLLLSAAARLARLLLSGSPSAEQAVEAYGVNLLHSLASLCVSPQHPVMLTLFAAVLNALYTPKLTRHEAISAVWSVMVMRYYERRVVSDVVEVWRGCDATTDAVVMTGEEQREVGAKPSNEHTRLRVVEKRRVQVMKAVDRLVAHINSVDGEAGEASRSVRRRAFWELSQVEATWATHRRLQRSASHLYDEQGLPHFRADLLQQLSDEAADHSNDGRPDYPRQVTFAAALLEQLAALGCSPLDSASLPSQPHLLLRLLGVRVPYPTPGNPSATLPLLLEPLGTAHISRPLGQRIRRKGSAEVQRRWLEGSGWPLLTVDSMNWKRLMELQNSDRPSMLERWVKEAVREWEERMAWEGWGDGSVVMDMELPRQARRLYVERHRQADTPSNASAALIAAA